MSIPNYSSPNDVILGIQSLDSTHLPENLRETFIKTRAIPVQVEMMVKVGHFIYANRSVVPNDFLIIGAAVTSFCTKVGFWGLSENNVGAMMVLALMKSAGIPHPLALTGSQYPDEDDFPAPMPEFAAAPESNPVPPTPEPTIQVPSSEE